MSKRSQILHQKLSISQARFADLVAAGVNKTLAYEKAFPNSGASKHSIHVMACNLAKKPEVLARIAEVQAGLDSEPEGSKEYEELKERLLNDPKWLFSEALASLYELGTAGASERTRLEAWKMIGSLKAFNWFVGQGSAGTTVTVNNQQLATTVESNDPDVLRFEVMKTLRQVAAPQAQHIVDVSGSESAPLLNGPESISAVNDGDIH